MKRTSSCSNQLSNPTCCSYISSHGRRCRMAASPNSPYCHSHAKNTVIVPSSLASELSQAAGSLSAPEDVNRVLAKIFLALAEDRLSTRKAAVLGYIGQMLLRSHREIAFHKNLANKEAERSDSHVPISCDVPWATRSGLRDAKGHSSNSQIVIDIAGMTPEPAAPAVTLPEAAPSKPDAESTAPADTSVPETPPSTIEPGSPPAPKNKPRVAKPASEPSQPYPPLADLNHFYPNDPMLSPSLQHTHNTMAPPGEEELRWRELSRRYAPPRRRM